MTETVNGCFCHNLLLLLLGKHCPTRMLYVTWDTNTALLHVTSITSFMFPNAGIPSKITHWFMSLCQHCLVPCKNKEAVWKRDCIAAVLLDLCVKQASELSGQQACSSWKASLHEQIKSQQSEVKKWGGTPEAQSTKRSAEAVWCDGSEASLNGMHSEGISQCMQKRESTYTSICTNTHWWHREWVPELNLFLSCDR